MTADNARLCAWREHRDAKARGAFASLDEACRAEYVINGWLFRGAEFE